MEYQREAGNGREPLRNAMALTVVAAGAAAGFGVLAAAVARRGTAEADEAVRRHTAAPRGSPARRAAAAAAPVGKWWTYIPAALAASGYLLAARVPDGRRPRSRMAGAGAVLLAGTVATALNPTFDHVLPQPPAPPGHASPRKPVFPSGHAFGPSAIALSAAYVLAREGVVRGGTALPVAALLPFATAGGRVLEEKHWASDVLGGYLGGVTVAALCAAAYEVARGACADEAPR